MPNNCWDDYKDFQLVLDAIHAEIKEYGFSKAWAGSKKGYVTLAYHLHRMYNYVSFPETFKEYEELVVVQFTAADEVESGKAEMQPSSHDLTQRPREPVSDDLGAGIIVDDTGCSVGVQHKASVPRTPLRTAATDEEMREVLSRKSDVQEDLHGYRQEEGRIHRKHKPVNIHYLCDEPKFWHRRGQYSVRISSIQCITTVTEKSFTVFLLNKMHYTMRFQSDKAAKSARRSLIMATGRP